MGKATRWLRGLLGMKKDKENVEKKEKKKWGFAKSGKDSGGLSQIPLNIPAAGDSAWLRSFIADSEKEQNKHAIAVAAATAAAADAAVAAAQAAVAVVRLTSRGEGGLFNAGGREKWAAVKIQTLFRGYLARKALRALRGLVKLQALVRGYLVRKRTAATLYSMQALIRAQAAVRSQRACRSLSNECRFHPEMRSRKSIERFDEIWSEYHSKRLSTSYDPSFDEGSKIVEIDTGRPRSRSRRMSTCVSEYGDDQYYYQVMSSPRHCSIPSRVSIPKCDHIENFDWAFIEEDYKSATAQSTPRLAFPGRANGPVTPTKSLCKDSFFRPYSNYPSYMANTQSFSAKLRSLSAPRQRLEPGPRKKLSLHEIMASRTSFSGVRMQKSYSQAQEDIEF